MDSKLGVIFDEEDSAKLNILIEAYEIDIYNLLASAIDTMYNYWQKGLIDG